MELNKSYNASGSSELLVRLERANEKLMYLKNNKEMSEKDLQKLELENSALIEENDYLKKRIKNVEKNAIISMNKSAEINSVCSFVSHRESNCENSFRNVNRLPIKDEKIENLSTSYTRRSRQNRPCINVRIVRQSANLTSRSHNFLLGTAILRSALAYNL